MLFGVLYGNPAVVKGFPIRRPSLTGDFFDDVLANQKLFRPWVVSQHYCSIKLADGMASQVFFFSFQCEVVTDETSRFTKTYSTCR